MTLLCNNSLLAYTGNVNIIHVKKSVSCLLLQVCFILGKFVKIIVVKVLKS